MKKFIFTVIVLTASIGNCMGQNAKSVLEAMELANSYFINKHPEAGAPTFVKKMRTSNLWTRGVYFEGLCELLQIEEATGSEQLGKNNQYLLDWGTAHKWSPRDGVKTTNADNYCCCQTYLDAFSAHPEWKVDLTPTFQCVDNLLGRPETLHDWTWIDAIQMGLPVLTAVSAEKQSRGDADYRRYADLGWKMYCWTRDTLAGGLFNEKEGLWWRDKDFTPPYKSPNGQNCYWSRGNGWVYAALVRAISDLKGIDGFDDQIKVYTDDFLKMTDALVKCQRKDFFWNVDLLDDTNFGGKELTGTSLFIYGMAWGVNNKVLDEKPYRKLILKTWKTMVKTCLHENGFLGYVQGTGKQPSDSQPVSYTTEPDFDDFGLGCFLLAGSEVWKMVM